jgi:hypothetical protein
VKFPRGGDFAHPSERKVDGSLRLKRLPMSPEVLR